MVDKDHILRSAVASQALEGLHVPSNVIAIGKKLLDGELTIDSALAEIYRQHLIHHPDAGVDGVDVANAVVN